MKIMWHSVPSEIKTGYGVLTKMFTSRLKKLGLEVIIASTSENKRNYVNSDGIQTLGKYGAPDDYGCRWLYEHYRHYQPDIVLSGTDPFTYDINVLRKLPNWASWVVIDSTPLNPVIAERLIFAKTLLAPSKFAQQTLKQVGFDSLYVPYAVDPVDYYPIAKGEAREQLSSDTGKDLENKFFVSTVAANIPNNGRKNFEKMFEIWGRFIKTHPDAVLYVHSMVSDEFGGLRLYRLQKFFGIPDENIIFAPQYHYKTGMLDESFLRLIYSASDCYFQPTKGEGFGLPVVEAQRCGTPIVATDCSTMPELCFGGQLVRGTPVMTKYETYWVDIDTEEALKALEHMYERKDVLELRELALLGAREYDVDNVLEKYMKPALDKILDMPNVYEEDSTVLKDKFTKKQGERL